MIKNNKKGDLREHVPNIIIAVICLVLLMGLVILVYQQLSDEKSQKAKKILDIIEVNVNALQAGEKTRFPVQGVEDWGLLGWGKDDEGRPDRCYFKSCVCVCPPSGGFMKMSEWSESCQKKGFCRFFDVSEIKFSTDKGKFEEYEKRASIMERESLGLFKKDKTEKDFALVFLRGNLVELEISKGEDNLQIKDTIGEEISADKGFDSDDLSGMIKAMCFINEEGEIADFDSVAGETAVSAAGFAGYAASQALANDMRESVLLGKEVIVKEGTKIGGLSSHMDTLRSFKESNLELKIAAENAVIKHFPEKGIYNIVWDPQSKRVIGQVTSQGYVRQISQDMVNKLGGEIKGIFGKTGGRILERSPSLHAEAELISKDGKRVVKFKDINIVGSKRALKVISDNTILHKALGKVSGKAFLVWGVFCDSIIIGLTAERAVETMRAVNEAAESVKEADQNLGVKMKEAVDRKIGLMELYLKTIGEKYNDKIESSGSAKEKYDEMNTFLKSAKEEGATLNSRYEGFLNNLDTEGGGGNKDLDFKITNLERKELYLQWKNLDDQLDLLQSQIIQFREHLAEKSDSLDLEKLKFNKMPASDYVSEQSYSIYASIIPSSSIFDIEADLDEFHRKNYIFENVAGVLRKTDFYFKHVKKGDIWDNPLFLGNYEIGSVEDGKILIDSGQMVSAISDLGGDDLAKQNSYRYHYKLLQGAGIEGSEIYADLAKKGGGQ